MTHQAFLTGMMTTSDEKLAKADPAKLAKQYGVNEDWVRMCLHFWRFRT